MDSRLTKATREYNANPSLDSGLALATEHLRAGTPQHETFRLLDKLYLQHGDQLRERLAQPNVTEGFSRYHADITETVEYTMRNFGTGEILPTGQIVVRREAQALEAMDERARAGPFVNGVTEHHVRHLSLHNMAVQVPEELIQLPYLERLYLGTSGVKTFEGIQNLPKLKYISLTDNNIPQKEIDEFRARGIEFGGAVTIRARGMECTGRSKRSSHLKWIHN